MRARGLTFSLSAPSCVRSAGYLPRCWLRTEWAIPPAIVLILRVYPKTFVAGFHEPTA